MKLPARSPSAPREGVAAHRRGILIIHQLTSLRAKIYHIGVGRFRVVQDSTADKKRLAQTDKIIAHDSIFGNCPKQLNISEAF